MQAKKPPKKTALEIATLVMSQSSILQYLFTVTDRTHSQMSFHHFFKFHHACHNENNPILFYSILFSIQADFVFVSFQTFRFFPHKASVLARGATQNFWNWSWNLKKTKLFEHDDDVSMDAGSRIRQLCRVYI